MLTHRGMLALAADVAADADIDRRRRAAGGDAALPRRRDELGAARPRRSGATDRASCARPIRSPCSTTWRAASRTRSSCPRCWRRWRGCRASGRFPALRVVWYGASPMPLPVLRACVALFPGRMAQVYGMTEASGAVTALPVADHEDPDGRAPARLGGPPDPGRGDRDPGPGHRRSRCRSASPARSGCAPPAHERLLGQAGGHRRHDHPGRLAAVRRRRAQSTPTATSTSPTGSRT